MEFTLPLLLQFLILGATTFFLSGLITFIRPQFPLAVIILMSSMAGYIFTASNQLGEFIIFASIINAILALTASWLVNYGQFVRKMAEKYRDVTA